MTPDPGTLLARIAGALGQGQVSFALIGAAALAVHGVSRSTLDIDVLVSERRVLDRSFWATLSDDVAIDMRVGDGADPLAGVIRFTADGERDVDVVVGRGAWVAEIVGRAAPVRYQGLDIPIARAADLILLKLYAGGSQDRWDIEQLLAGAGRDAVIDAVEQSLPQLPSHAHRLWRTLRGGT
jgi:hypothetical protein